MSSSSGGGAFSANPSRYARCECVISDGFRVDVGFFGGQGLGVSACRGDLHGDYLGVAAARKFPSASSQDKLNLNPCLPATTR